MKRTAGLLGLLLMGGCGEVKIVAHRGASFDAPENTVAAMRLGFEQGADAVETDVHLTKDGRLAISHDETTKRAGGVDWKVVQHTLGELMTLDVGKWKGEKWAGERLPSLEQVLATVPRGKGIYVEVKCGPEAVPALRQAIAASGLGKDQVVVISFREDVIARVKREMPWIKAYWLFAFKKDEKTGKWNETHEGLLLRANATGADGVDLAANERVDERLARMLRDGGLELHVWTVNDPALARRMIELGAESITTDRPGWLRQKLNDQ